MACSAESELQQTEFYMAAGHLCWGILMGPASGESMASLIALGNRTGGSPHRSTLPLCKYQNQYKVFQPS
jgi:hypothetical protein